MSRVKWKGPFINKAVLYFMKSDNCKYNRHFKNIKNSLIVPQCVGFIFQVHTGRDLEKLKINSDMVGFKFGEFCLTRKPFSFKKKKKKQK